MHVRDSNYSLVTKDRMCLILNDVYHDFVERTQCNKNELIFSLADDSSDGVIKYDRNANAAAPARTAPTVTLVDVEGFNYYKISNCERIDRVERWVTDSDGDWTLLSPVDQFDIDDNDLLSGDGPRPRYYETLDVDTLRFLREMSSDAYTIKFRVRYRERVVDIVDEDDPDAAANDGDVPISIPFRFRKALIYGTAGWIFLDRGDERANTFLGKYEALLAECAGIKDVKTSDKGTKPKMTYMPMGN